MKRRATAILLGIMVSSMFLSACGKNEAKEAANESAQVEEEGVGEVTEEGEKVEWEMILVLIIVVRICASIVMQIMMKKVCALIV